jgi:hypothetical protein
MKHGQTLVLAAAGVVGALVLATGAAHAAPAPAEFQDPAGDSGPGPDITKVVVSGDDAGTISFRVEIPNRPNLGSNHWIELNLDTDSNPSTGDPKSGGADYYLGMLGSAVLLFHWNGSAWEPVGASTATSVYSNGAATLTVKASDLGGITAFRFWVGTSDSPTDQTNWDPAPEAGTWSYSLLAPAAPVAPAAAAIRSILVVWKPQLALLGVNAGKTLGVKDVTVRLENRELVEPDSYTCRATIGGRTLPKRGRCAWHVPDSAARKQVVVTITVTYQGTSEEFTRAVKVKRR